MLHVAGRKTEFLHSKNPLGLESKLQFLLSARNDSYILSEHTLVMLGETIKYTLRKHDVNCSP